MGCLVRYSQSLSVSSSLPAGCGLYFLLFLRLRDFLFCGAVGSVVSGVGGGDSGGGCV
jgi:hypothetical protein